jgi:Domain of unknown function (DUF1906)
VTLVGRSVVPTVVDTSAKITASSAAALYSAGVRTVGRYVFFGSPRAGDIDAAELELLTAAGLTVFLIQHVRNPGWVASAAEGLADGKTAVANAQKASYASAGALLSLALDMEGVRNPGSDAFAHADSWCREVRKAGYWPLVYVGYDSGLDGDALDGLGGEPAFWCDYAPLSARPKPAMGYALHQQMQTSINGMPVDVDAVLQDSMVYGLAEADINQEPVDPREAPTSPEVPLPFYARDTEPPPPDRT